MNEINEVAVNQVREWIIGRETVLLNELLDGIGLENTLNNQRLAGRILRERFHFLRHAMRVGALVRKAYSRPGSKYYTPANIAANARREAPRVDSWTCGRFTREQVIAALSGRERVSMGELMTLLDSPPTAAARHAAVEVLRGEGWILRRRARTAFSGSTVWLAPGVDDVRGTPDPDYFLTPEVVDYVARLGSHKNTE